MKTKVLAFLVVLCVGLGILVADSFSATGDSRKRLQARKLMILPETEIKYPKAIDMYRSLSGKFVICEDIQPECGVIKEHTIVGNTWWDYQSNSTIGRRMGVMPQNAFRHFTWSYVAGPDSARYVYANCYDPWTPFWTGPKAVDGGPDRRSVYAYYQEMHYDPATGLRKEIPAMTYGNFAGDPEWYTTLSIDDDECDGGWQYKWDVPDWICGTSYDGGSFPRCKVVHVPFTENTGRDYFHIAVLDQPEYWIFRVGWVRCYLDQTTPAPNLISETYHNGQYKQYTTPEGTPSQGHLLEPVALVDTLYYTSAMVESSPVSERVAIVYTRAVAGDHENQLWGCDVVFVESMNNGNDWLAGTPFVPYNCTNYPAECEEEIVERAFVDLGACYDYEDSLHIAYITTYVPCPVGGFYYPQYAWVYHWSKKTGNRVIQYYEETEDIHHWNEACISKVSISAKDPIYHPDEGVYLFCTWTQVDSADVSLAGFGNRDIFACGSADGGDNWGDVCNLTNTQTAGCAPGECVSEGWPSLAQNMYNGDLHIQYICDRDAGPCVWDEGAWTDNDVYYLDLEEWVLVTYPQLDYRIEEPPNPPNWNRPPLKVPAEGRDVKLKVFNIGNAPLVYSVTDDGPVCIETPGAMPPLAAGDSASVTITLKGSGGCENTFVDGNVIITTNEPDEDSLPIQAVVDVEDYYECPREEETCDTLENSMEGVQSGLILYTNANCEEWFHYYDHLADTTHKVGFRGGIIIATIRDNDTLVGRCMGEKDHKADAQDSLYVQQCDVDWEPHYWILYARDIFINDLDPPKNDKWFCWTISKQVKFFKPTAPEPYRNIIIKYVKVKRQAPPGWWPGGTTDCANYGKTYVGMAMDIDCPWDTLEYQAARNFSGYDAVNHIAYQRGWDYTGEHPQYNDFYCGMALAEETDDTVNYQAVAPFGTYNVRNDSFLYPQNTWGWLDGELYELAANNTPGMIQDADTLYGLDRTQVFTALKIPAGSDPDAEANFILVEAVASGGLAQLEAYVDSARKIVAREKYQGVPAICADVNDDGIVDLGDLLFLISFLYKGGASPIPLNSADVNSDDIVDLGDVLALISYLYKGGDVPSCPICPGVWFL